MSQKWVNATLEVGAIITDREFQMRAAGLDQEHLEDIVEAIGKGEVLPRVEVVDVEGAGLILVGGFHRLEGHILKGLKKIKAVVLKGSLLDATVVAAQNRGDKGLKWRIADRQRAVDQVLYRLKGAKQNWSSGKIADTLGVSKDMVEGRRKLMEQAEQKENEKEAIPLEEPPRVGKDGRERPAPAPKPAPAPAAPAAPVPSVKTPAPASVEAARWEDMPLEEFLEVDDFVWEGIRRSRVATAGDLYERIRKGERFGLPRMESDTMKEQIERMRDAFLVTDKQQPKPAPPPKPGAMKEFDFNAFDVHYGNVSRGPDQLSAMYPAFASSPSMVSCQAALREFREHWEKLKRNIQQRAQ